MLQSIQALIITLTLTAFTFADVFMTELTDPQNSSDAGRYVELYNNEQADAIAEEIFLPPVIVKSSGESGDSTHTIMATESELSDMFKSIFEAIKPEGWKESVVYDFDIDFKGLDIAFVHIEYDRLKENGEPILPAKRNASYVLLKYKSGWRIISALRQSNPNPGTN